LEQLVEAPIPHFQETEKTGVFGGWNLMISKFSTKREQALEFLKYILEKRNQMTLHEKSGYMPILNSIYTNADIVKKNPQLSYYNFLLNKGRHRPFREDYTQMSDILSFYFKQTLKNDLTIDAAIEKAANDINTDQAFIF
jgi:multiple sugar transport system substrate-binding protein